MRTGFFESIAWARDFGIYQLISAEKENKTNGNECEWGD